MKNNNVAIKIYQHGETNYCQSYRILYATKLEVGLSDGYVNYDHRVRPEFV